MNAILNHLNRDYLFLQLESVPIEQMADESNIILETENLFKEIETKILFRHEVVILDQENYTFFILRIRGDGKTITFILIEFIIAMHIFIVYVYAFVVHISAHIHL